MRLQGGGMVSVPLGPGGHGAGPTTAGWLRWKATGALVGAGGPGSWPGWRGPVPWCSMAGGPVFRAQAVAVGVGSSSQGCFGGRSSCLGVRGSCW